MNYRFLKSACAAALMASGGQAFAQVQDSQDVQVSLTVNALQDISLDLGGALTLTEDDSEAIQERFVCDTCNPRDYEALTKFTTGCLALTDVPNIKIAISGSTQAPGTDKGFLKATLGAVDSFLQRKAVLRIGPVGTNFETMFNDASKPTVSPNENGGIFTMSSDLKNFDADLWNASASVGTTPCGDGQPNIALGVMVGVDQGLTLTDPEARQYHSTSEFISRNQANGEYVFTDTVTVTITPRLG